MKKYQLTITEEQREELKNLCYKMSSESSITNDFLRRYVSVSTDDIRTEAYRLNRLWSTLYSNVIMAERVTDEKE